MPRVDLNDGQTMPQLGFGVFQVPPEDTAEAVGHALRTGYRAVDTAAAYRNERGVGEAIRESGLGRQDVHVTTKVWNGNHGRDEARAAFDKSLARLGFDYVDLYLIHWPVPARDRYVEAWETLVELKQDGRARSIGASNFQVELHPHFQQAELRRFHSEQGIATEAWSPLAQGAVLDEEPLVELASAHGKTPAQVVLRWHLQLGNVVIPKSVTPERIEENFDLFDFELGDDEMRTIEELDRGDRIGPDPATFALA